MLRAGLLLTVKSSGEGGGLKKLDSSDKNSKTDDSSRGNSLTSWFFLRFLFFATPLSISCATDAASWSFKKGVRISNKFLLYGRPHISSDRLRWHIKYPASLLCKIDIVVINAFINI
jgi:hypothetical protein